MTIAAICSFSAGIGAMTRKDQSSLVAVLRVLKESKRFSVFEATENQVIPRMMTRVFEKGYVRDIGGACPWTNIERTELGEQLAGEL